MMIESTTGSPKRRTPEVLRWLSLVDLHGSQYAALVALLRVYDEHARLKRAVRACGLCPEILASEAHAQSLPAPHGRKVTA